MEPYRAFVADKLDASQQATGFQAQSFFTGFGQTLANYSLAIFPVVFVGYPGKLPTWVFASFFLGAVCSVASVWWSMRTTPEIPPTPGELAEIKRKNEGMPHPVVQFFLSIITTIIAYAAIVVLLNFKSKTAKVNTGADIGKAKILINNYPVASSDGTLKPFEAVIYELK